MVLNDVAQAAAWWEAGQDIVAVMTAVDSTDRPDVVKRMLFTIAWLTGLLDGLHHHATRDSDCSVISW